MTPADSPLVEILRRTRALLIDFDGPICSVFAYYSAAAVADGLRRVVAAHGAELPQNQTPKKARSAFCATSPTTARPRSYAPSQTRSATPR